MAGFFVQLGVTVALSVASSLLARRRKDDIQKSEPGIISLSSGPARWIVGRARAGGLRAYYREVDPLDPAMAAGPLESDAGDGYRDLHLAVAVSEGVCDGVDAIWIDGVRYDLRIDDTESDGALRYRSVSPVPPYASRTGDLFCVRACFSASGTQGQTFRAAAAVPSGAPFLQGISWIHLHLRQPVDEGDRMSRGVGWQRLPEIEFLVRGVEIGGAWTDSAVSVREWWHRTVLGDDTPFNASALAAARTRGDERISTGLAGNYWKYEPAPEGPGSGPSAWGTVALDPTAAEPVVWASEMLAEQQGDEGERRSPLVGVWQPPFPWKVRMGDGTIATLREVVTDDVDVSVRYRRSALMHRARRYSAAGIISADLSPDDLAEEFDFAMQGSLVHTGSEWVMVAGEDRAPVLTWDVDEEALLEWGTSPSDAERFSGLDMNLVQSAPADYTESALPRLADGTSTDFARLRSALLVTHPIDGGRLLATHRRRSLQERRYAVVARPDDPAVYSLKRGDVITFTLRAAALESARCTIESITIRPDLTVLAEMVVTPEGAYADTIELPPADDMPVATLPPLVGAPTDRPVVSVEDAAWRVIERASQDAIPSMALALSLAAEPPATRLLMFLTTNPDVPVHSPLRYGYWLDIPSSSADGSPFGHTFRRQAWMGNADGTFDDPTDIPSAPALELDVSAVTLTSVPVAFTLTVTAYNGTTPLGAALVRPLAGGAIPRLQDLSGVDDLPSATGDMPVWDHSARRWKIRSHVFEQATEPANPVVGDVWRDTS